MKRGTPDHPKVAELAVKIDQPIYAAVGLLELLWHFTAQFCPRGNVGKYPDKSLCAGMKWGKSRINLIETLIECGFLERHDEHRLIVHDWQDHADQSVRRKLERIGESFVTSQQLVIDESLTSISRANALALASKDISSSAVASEEPTPFPAQQLTEQTPEPQPSKASLRNDEAKLWFDVEFWPAYWRKVDKSAALKAFRKCATGEAEKNRIVAAVKVQEPYYRSRDPEHQPHAATWLNKRRYEDDLGELFKPPPPTSNGHHVTPHSEVPSAAPILEQMRKWEDETKDQPPFEFTLPQRKRVHP